VVGAARKKPTTKWKIARTNFDHDHTVLQGRRFASCLADADLMIKAMRDAEKLFAINRPLAWYPSALHLKRS
jgi:hypothetical protein